jgi:hypothetical protein
MVERRSAHQGVGGIDGHHWGERTRRGRDRKLAPAGKQRQGKHIKVVLLSFGAVASGRYKSALLVKWITCVPKDRLHTLSVGNPRAGTADGRSKAPA